MSSRKRITAALVGLIALVVIGWFVRELTDNSQHAHRGSAMSVAASGLWDDGIAGDRVSVR
jgi:hypothetical protein